MWRQEVKAKELAIAQVQKELRLKDEAKVNINRTRDALLRKMEINCQRNKDEASIVFLPCAHQVLCANCTEDHYKNVEANWCPCCQDRIAQIIGVYGTGS